MKIKAHVASTAVRSWQPNGYSPDPDSELQAMIDGADSDQIDDVKAEGKE